MVKERKTNKEGTENDKSSEVRMASERKNKGEENEIREEL